MQARTLVTIGLIGSLSTFVAACQQSRAQEQAAGIGAPGVTTQQVFTPGVIVLPPIVIVGKRMSEQEKRLARHELAAQ